ncbi:MAG: hypothetical protein AAF662_06490 [Pseudomonadota bacterium]
MANIDARLKKLEGQIGTDRNMVVIVKEPGETEEEMEARLEAWKRGEPGARLSPNCDKKYQGGEFDLIVVRVVEGGT